MFKKSKKTIDMASGPCNSGLTHGKHITTKQMRTKALLCLAVLAAGVATCVAQSNVYSLNIVGYVNMTIPGGYSLIANPLSNGATNGANEIMNPIDGQQILTWNGSRYNYVSYDSGFGGWIDIAQAPSKPPSLPPGAGFFFYNPGAATNVTFVGNVVPGPGSTNTLVLPGGYSLVGSPLPVGNATNITSAPVNLPLVDGMQILTWNGSAYVYSSYDSGFGGWINIAQQPKAPPGYSIGQAFFYYNPGVATNWVQSLQ